MSEEQSKPQQRDVDWAAIERHYRAGELSLNEIAKRYGVSRPGIATNSTSSNYTVVD